MTGDLWVFGYGSLMWKPGFAAAEVRPARLRGYRRCFCITSVHHRGTLERPGLVLGLDHGGMCQGLAFRVPHGLETATVAALRAREQVNGVYRERLVSIETGDGRHLTAIAYVAERAHPSYAGGLAVRTQARIIRAARGLSGTNLDYLANTLAHMALLGIREPELERVLALSGAVIARGNGDERRRRICGLVTALQPVPVPGRRLSRVARKRFGYRTKLGGGSGVG